MALVIDDTIISNQEQNLKAAMSTDPKMRKVIQQHIREALFEARRKMTGDVPFENGDPRGAARSIRTSVYEKVLGGNINILTGNKAHGAINYEPPRKLTPGQRGGNRQMINLIPQPKVIEEREVRERNKSCLTALSIEVLYFASLIAELRLA